MAAERTEKERLGKAVDRLRIELGDCKEDLAAALAARSGLAARVDAAEKERERFERRLHEALEEFRATRLLQEQEAVRCIELEQVLERLEHENLHLKGVFGEGEEGGG